MSFSRLFNDILKMYKHCSKLVKRKDKDTARRVNKKMEGNSNITAKRLTVPPGFLNLGIVSDTAVKDSSPPYEEKVYGFLGKSQDITHQNLRRSARISQRNVVYNIPNSSSSSSYCDSEPKIRKYQHRKTSYKKSKFPRNNSKSLFHKINKRYAQIEKQNNHSYNSTVEHFVPIRKTKEYFTNIPIHPDFCVSLSQQICVNIGNQLNKCRSRLRDKIKNIDNIISGKIQDNMSQSNNENLFSKHSSSESNQNMNFFYVPPSEWVYETPPRQKTIVPKVTECNIQPAVLYTNNNRKILYEMNPNFTIDLTGFSSGQNVPYNQRFMQHVATVDRSSTDMDEGIRFLDTKEQKTFDFFGQFKLSEFEAHNSGQNLFNFKNIYSKSPQ